MYKPPNKKSQPSEYDFDDMSTPKVNKHHDEPVGEEMNILSFNEGSSPDSASPSKAAVPKSEMKLLPVDESDVAPYEGGNKYNPLSYFSSGIVKRVKELGGLFPKKLNRSKELNCNGRKTLQFDTAVMLFTLIDWQGNSCKYY